MLRIYVSESAEAAIAYHKSGLKTADYYIEGQEKPGLWHGTLAEQLGLTGEVGDHEFESLVQNRHPVTGEQITPRMAENRRPGYDFNFHVPKSVSLAYAVGGDDRIMEVFQQAVRETMQQMELEVQTQVRRDKVAQRRTTGSLVWAEYVHLTARPVKGEVDPHLHAHCYVMNMTMDEAEGRMKALELFAVKRDAPYFQECFHARLADSVRNLGYDIVHRGKSWEIGGISEASIREFSKRTELIEATAQRLGITDPDRKAELGAKTREKKMPQLGMKQLRNRWLDRFIPDERDRLLKLKARSGRGKAPQIGADESITYGLDANLQRSSVAKERQILASALQHGFGSLTIGQVHAAWKRSDVLRERVDGETFVTTEAILAQERRLLDFARDGRGACRPIAGAEHVFTDPRLNEQQRRAVRHVLESPDRVMLLRGAAGVGKTTLMREAVPAIERAGKNVMVIAPSSDASRGVLRSEGFKDAQTVATFLDDKTLHANVRRGVIWVDEAGTVGTKSLAQLVDVAKRQGARLVLSGDTRQHAPVERGDPMRLLESHAGLKAVEVTEIQRQRGTYREAVDALSRGDIKSGFEKLDAMGAIHELTAADRLLGIAEKFAQCREQGRSVLAISPTHAEGEAVSAQIRDELRRSGAISGRDHQAVRLRRLDWTDAQKGELRFYEPGQVVQFARRTKAFTAGERVRVMSRDDRGFLMVERDDGSLAPLPIAASKNWRVYEQGTLALAKGDSIRITQNGLTADRRHAVHNGSSFTIESFAPDGSVRLGNGWRLPRDFGHWDHGYCRTSHSSQGKTVDVVLISESSASFAAASKEQFYVSASRARSEIAIYTDDHDGLLAAVSRSRPRMSATELVMGDRRASDDGATERSRQQALAVQRQAEQRRAVDQREQTARDRRTVVTRARPASEPVAGRRASDDRAAERSRQQALVVQRLVQQRQAVNERERTARDHPTVVTRTRSTAPPSGRTQQRGRNLDR